MQEKTKLNKKSILKVVLLFWIDFIHDKRMFDNKIIISLKEANKLDKFYFLI